VSRQLSVVCSISVLMLLCMAAAMGAVSPTDTEKLTAIVAKVQRADYEGNRSALKQLYGELAPYANNRAISSRVAYWRGFALWRSALNGFNDSGEKQELALQLQQALAEFAKSAELDPDFVDAKVGEISCLSNLMFLHQNDPAEIGKLLTQLGPITKEAQAADPRNPRLLWVLGPNYWYTPADRGGGQAKAIASYEKGLEIIRNDKAPPVNPLDPTWGEPELLMNLAWSNLNKTAPDVDTAQRDAEAALKQVPYWHYVRDILLPQIQAARQLGH
jgi:tetratricopeptide (TPR) repeat protein